MNEFNSKYFKTALRMDEALIALLEKKDLEYITVKEICEEADVNRSTFYLHYETVGDLVDETTEMINKRFLSYFPRNERDISDALNGLRLGDLILVTGNTLYRISGSYGTIKKFTAQPSETPTICRRTHGPANLKNASSVQYLTDSAFLRRITGIISRTISRALSP